MGYDFETRAIHGNPEQHAYRDATRAVSFPIFQTATFGHIGLGQSTGFDYTRESNPTRRHLEDIISALEGASDTVALSSGMAAISVCFDLLSPGDHVICSEDLYGGAVRLFGTIGAKNELEFDYVNTGDMEAVRAHVKPNTRALYIETPSNPMMRVTDLAACAALAKAHGLLLMVDNTFLSPRFQQPMALGADLVLHSGSKFLSGHNDVISGFLSSASPELAARVRLIAKTTGGVLGPFDSWLVLRGLKTLSVRMERQQKSAAKIARWLCGQKHVARVHYVGLPEHPGHAVNKSQSSGAGSMISFHVDSEEMAQKVLERVRLITFAESLGGTESLITYPLRQTHADVPAAARERLGITQTLLRLSVGLESVDDLIADLAQALADESN